MQFRGNCVTLSALPTFININIRLSSPPIHNSKIYHISSLIDSCIIMTNTVPKLHDILPALILGTAPLSTQYTTATTSPTTFIQAALNHGIHAFDTSPYYGNAEEILGSVLYEVRDEYPRSGYKLITKAGRIASDQFDFSPEWIRTSIKRSLERLRTDSLDVVLAHDVEFADSHDDVLGAVRELRRLRDEEGVVKFVGISGYPVHILADIAEKVLRETGEPLDAVMSYAHFTLQNHLLLSESVPRFQKAGVGVMLNASILGMGLLRQQGVPVGEQGDWHPAPAGLREAAASAAALCKAEGESLENVTLRWTIERWMNEGRDVGSYGEVLKRKVWREHGSWASVTPRTGINVIGVSNIAELDETVTIYKSILDREDVLVCDDTVIDSGTSSAWSPERTKKIFDLTRQVQDAFGEWAEYSWKSPPPGFVNKTKPKPT